MALSGLLGQRTSTVTAAEGGYRLVVTYPSIIRPGVDVRWKVVASSQTGFGKTLSIAMSRHYLDLFDLNSIQPEPDAMTSDGASVVYSWNAPPGHELDLGQVAVAVLESDGKFSFVKRGDKQART